MTAARRTQPQDVHGRRRAHACHEPERCDRGPAQHQRPAKGVGLKVHGIPGDGQPDQKSCDRKRFGGPILALCVKAEIRPTIRLKPTPHSSITAGGRSLEPRCQPAAGLQEISKRTAAPAPSTSLRTPAQRAARYKPVRPNIWSAADIAMSAATYTTAGQHIP